MTDPVGRLEGEKAELFLKALIDDNEQRTNQARRDDPNASFNTLVVMITAGLRETLRDQGAITMDDINTLVEVYNNTAVVRDAVGFVKDTFKSHVMKGLDVKVAPRGDISLA